MTHPLRFGLKLSGQDTTIDALRAVWRIADESGFDHVWDFDHLASIGGGGPDRPVYEGWTLQAAMAEATRRVRIGCLVTGNTYRNPALLAKSAVTVDHLSGGRLDIGIGAGSDQREHRELGIAYPGDRERTERLEEAVQVIRLLMAGDRASFDGAHYHLDGGALRPPPAQSPTPPIWIGAGGDRRTIPIAARRADVWHCFSDFEELPHKLAVFAEAAERAGRDPASVTKATNLSIDDDWEDVAERVRALRELGFAYLVVPWPAGGEERVEEFAHRVMPRLLG